MTGNRKSTMKQLGLGLNLSTKRTRKREFLDEMERVVPWAALVQIVEPHCPCAKTGRPPFAVETMLRIHYLQQWFALSDPAMEEALHDTPVFREFAKIVEGAVRLPDESTILRFRHVLERHNLAPDMLRLVNDILGAKGLMLRTGTVVDATLIAAPSSTKNADGQRDPEMKPTRKGNNWYFGMKAHIGVDARSGLVHTVVGTAANVNDLTWPGRCCTARKKWRSATPATRACTNGLKLRDPRGTWRCGRACAASSTRSSRLTSWPSGWRR